MPEMIDHYRIDHMLGQGGMGVVYQATDMNLQRPVAIKVMHPHLASNPEFQQRFMQEARAAASLDHPNIVRVLYFGMHEDQLFLVMDLIAGGSLREYLQHLHLQRTSLELHEVVEFGRQIADALNYAHQRDMIHRDVKPDNVLLKPVTRDNLSTFQAMLTDFGLAKLSESMVQSVPGQTMGTFPYMSPEQCRGEELDGRSDIYSVGVLLYELATGRLPFLAKNLNEAIRMHTSDPVPDPNSIRPGLPIPLVDIIMRALAKSPNDRFATAGDMAQALQRLGQALENQPTIPELPGAPVDSLATYLMSQPGSLRQSTMTMQQRGPMSASQAGVDRLTVVSDAGVSQVFPLTKDDMVIGRNPASDIVLSSEKVSRTHARVTRRPDGTFTITDLGSANGTWLNNERLAPNVATNWTPGQTIRVGDFQITLQLASGAQAVKRTSEMAAPVPPTGRTQSPPQNAGPKVSAVLVPNVVEVRPGGQVELTVEVTNLSDRADSFLIQLPNVPREWVTYPAEPLQLFPGDKGNFRVRFHPPATGTSAGQFGFQVRVGTGGQGDVTVNGTIRVLASNSFTFDLQPRRLSRSGDAVLIVTNTGNAQDSYTVYAQDANESLVFNVGQAKFSLGPGQVGQIPLQVIPLRQPLIGGTSLVPFDVTIQAASMPDQMQTQRGEYMLTSRIPTLALGVIPAACAGLFLVMLVILAIASGQNSSNAVTQTALAASRTAIANQTQIALAGTLNVTPSPSSTTSTFPTLTSPPFFFTDVPQPTSIFVSLNRTQTAQALAFAGAATQTSQAQTLVAINNQQAIAAATATAQAAIQIALFQTVTAQVAQLTQAAQQGQQQAALQTATALAIQVATAQQAANQTATAQSAIQAALNQTSTAQAILVQQAAATQTAIAVTSAAQAQLTAVAQQTAAAVAAQQTQIAGQTAAAGAAQTAAANTQLTQAAGAALTATVAQQTLIAGQTVAAGNAQQTAIVQQTQIAEQTAAAGAAQQTQIAQQTLIAGQTVAAGNAQQTAIVQQTQIAEQTAAAGAAQQTQIAQQTALADAAQQTQIAQQTAGAALTATAAAANSQPQFIQVAAPNTINNNMTVLTNPTVNGNTSALLFVTSNVSATGVVNPAEVGIGWNGSAWVILTENQSPMLPNSAFNVDAQNPGQTIFFHQANQGNTAGHITEISNPATDNQPNAILIVTQNFSAGNTLNPHPIGVAYDPGKNKWTIFNTDQAPMPANAAFNIQVLGAGPNAFAVQANGPNIRGNEVVIDNPALDGHPEALLVITQAGTVPNPHVVGVRYDPSINKWVILNMDNGAMPAGATFFVKII
jgi:serine/threonine protein kinase